MELFPDPGVRIAFVRLIEDHERGRTTASARPKTPKTAKGEYGEQAQKLRLYSNWMGNPKVWEAFGTDEEYCAWVQEQECAYCGRKPDWEMDTYVKNECAHVRRVANGAGEAIKPPFSAIPLCHKDHGIQHQHGEGHFGGKEWFDRERMKHLADWLWGQMKQTFSVASMRELPPATLLEYAEAAELERFLPECYREAKHENE